MASATASWISGEWIPPTSPTMWKLRWSPAWISAYSDAGSTDSRDRRYGDVPVGPGNGSGGRRGGGNLPGVVPVNGNHSRSASGSGWVIGSPRAGSNLV